LFYYKKVKRRKNYVNKLKNKTIALLFTVLLAISMICSIATISAHDPLWQIPTFAAISVAPDPVGVGQNALIYCWLNNPPFYNAAVTNNYRFHNYKLTITDPDGVNTTQVVSYIADSTNSQNFPFVPSKIGTYILTFTYPGETITADLQPAGSAYVGDVYLPSSAHVNLNVQQDPVTALQSSPLPTNYWERPIEGQNTAWTSVASNYLYPFLAAYSFGAVRLQPDGTSPNSAHIMWTKPINAGGIVGGNNGYEEPNSPSAGIGVDAAAYYPGLSYECRFTNPIIINGNLYYALPNSNNNAGMGYVAINLRTGQQVWYQNFTVNPSFGILVNFDSPNQHGVIPSGYLVAVSGTTWMLFDAGTGNWVFNITNVPTGNMQYGSDGEPIIYQFDPVNHWLALWNFTDVITNGPLNALSSAGWRPVNQVINSTLRGSNAYSWNVTVPNSLPATSAIAWPVGGDLLFGYGNARGTTGQPTFGGVYAGSSTSYTTFWALSLKPNSVGTLLWQKDIAAPPGNVTVQVGAVDPINRVFLMSIKETYKWYGYDLDSGNLLWGPKSGDMRAFNYYPTIGSGGVSQIGYIAYGNFYVGGYGGEIFCYNDKTGDEIWSYGGGGLGNSTNSGDSTPWGLYPTFVGAINDGKIFVYSGEHSPNDPLYKGEQLRCLNATTGQELWTIDSWACVGGFADQGFPVADGQLAYLNAYDMQIYSLGQGPSKLTVTAPDVATIVGTPVVIRGTVTDISAGTKQSQQAADFPNGVPCVSDASESSWMEYVYMQKPMPTDSIGVPVTISVIDSNNNERTVGTTTSDRSGMFTFAWAPDIAGQYTVMATFAGSNSYYGSSSETSFYAMNAPATAAPTSTPLAILATTTDLLTYIAAATIIIVIAIAIVGLLLLRKRK